MEMHIMHISATWRIRLNRPYAAVMRPYIKLTTFISCLPLLHLYFTNKWQTRQIQ